MFAIGGGSDDDYQLATAERCFVRNLERLYIRLRQETLGIAPPASKPRRRPTQ